MADTTSLDAIRANVAHYERWNHIKRYNKKHPFTFTSYDGKVAVHYAFGVVGSGIDGMVVSICGVGGPSGLGLEGAFASFKRHFIEDHSFEELVRRLDWKRAKLVCTPHPRRREDIGAFYIEAHHNDETTSKWSCVATSDPSKRMIEIPYFPWEETTE